MLYNYKLTLSQMGQIKNYKKDKEFTHSLLSVEDIELSTYEIDCKIEYKKTVPLNMFEKYSIRLIEKADEISSEMNVIKIAQLLHLDKKLIEDNLENLEAIGMLYGVKSDIITINRDENSDYLQYENKFKVDSIDENYHMTKNEYDTKEEYIKSVFTQSAQHKDKKYKNVTILDEKSSSKQVKILNYTNGNFLILGQNGVNQNNDLKFIDEATLFRPTEKSKDDVYCHYDEFLALLRDELAMNRDKIVVISSKVIEESNLDILKATKNLKDIYILSHTEQEHHRVFNVKHEDFVLLGENLYSKHNDYVIKHQADTFTKKIVDSLSNYFIEKIVEIIPEYNHEEIKRIKLEIERLKKQLDTFEIPTINEIDRQIKKINEEKNKLYGLTNKQSKARAAKRKEIDKLEKEGKENELKNYPIYLDNRVKIFELKKKVKSLEEEIYEIDKINKTIASLNKEKSDLIPKDKKEKISPLESELNNIQRLINE